MKFIDDYTEEEIAEHTKKVFKSLGITVIFDESIPEGEMRWSSPIVSKNHLGDNLKKQLK